MTGKATLPCYGTTHTSLSDVPLPDECVVVFDLDDTLYPEREFVRSAFRAVARHVDADRGVMVFERLWSLFESHHADPIGETIRHFQLPHSKRDLLEVYRNHCPQLALPGGIRSLLERLQQTGHPLGLLTDGRSATQRNKISALGLDTWFDQIVISEEFGSNKPDERNYRHFASCFPGHPCAYVGDNLAKDFIAPNRLGWQTIGVKDRGQNIHPQLAVNVVTEAMPEFWIETLA